MITIFLAIILFLDMIHYLIIADVILSWLMLFGIRFRPKFLVQIITPLYTFIQKAIPTKFGAFDFTPIIALIIILFLKTFLLISFPAAQTSIESLLMK